METFRPKTGWAFGLVVASLAILGLLWGLPDNGWEGAASVIPLVLLLIFSAWAAFVRPAVKVDQEGVELVNVLRTHKISWGAIERIDTRWALALFTKQGRYSAWAAPAPGRHAGLLANREQGEHLPESTYLAGTIRPGDLINTDSGAAAALIRRMWDEKKHLALPATVKTKWHWKTIIVFLFLIALASFRVF
jgi:hypothetical protein